LRPNKSFQRDHSFLSKSTAQNLNKSQLTLFRKATFESLFSRKQKQDANPRIGPGVEEQLRPRLFHHIAPV
jgi:hypothetical protein